MLAAAGFVALVALPGVLIASAALRGLARAWQPGALAARVTDEHGGAPRLAGWIAVVWLGALAIASLMYQSIWLIARHTAFHPLATSFLAPGFATVIAVVCVALSWPCARLFGWLAGAIDARWRRRRPGRRSLLRPRVLFAATGALTVATAAALWLLMARPQLGPLDISPSYGPALGLAAALAVHLAWPRLGRARVATGVVLAGAALTALISALATPFARPALALELWGDQPLAGLAIDTLFSLDTIRNRISLAELAPEPRANAPHPDIVLVTIDTVRADHTPPYGGQADMPALRELASRGTVFDWAFSPSNVTRRSIPSLVTGLAPTRVRGRVIGWALRVDPRHVVLAERLRAGGYDTAGFMCCEGFWGKEFHTGLERGLAHLEIDARGQALSRAASAWITARDNQLAVGARPPLFLWMHVIDPHNWPQGNGDPRNDTDRRRLYDHALATSDQMLHEVVAAFARRPADQQPIVIVTADHGEALGDHGQPYHSTDLYDSQIRVPFVIAGPGIRPQRIAETVSGTDLVPTILELAGFVAPHGASIDGRSLADLLTGARPGNTEGGVAFAAMIHDRSNPGGVTAIIKGRWKLIDNHGIYELYDTRSDPDERISVLRQHPDQVAELRRLLYERTAQAKQSPFAKPDSPTM
jgi:arylsulfatase A-like enzyme